jgi:hypothetical protein
MQKHSSLIAILSLSACGSMEGASVTVTYDIDTQSEVWRLPELGRKNVEDAFKAFAEKHQYKCRADFKHPDDTLCRGANGEHLAFRPVLNKHAYKATFGAVDSADRTHAQFVSVVDDFKTHMSAVAGEKNVASE